MVFQQKKTIKPDAFPKLTEFWEKLTLQAQQADRVSKKPGGWKVKILEIKNIVRKDVPIYYRRLYTCVAVIEVINKSQNVRLDFSIEHKPTGQKEILITLIDKVDYPLLPLNSALKKAIDDLDSAGSLPG